MENDLKWLAVTILIIFSGLLGGLLLTNGHDWGEEFAANIMQAQSIVGKNPDLSVVENGAAVERSDQRARPVAWGTALLLAPLYRSFGFDILALKSLNVVCYVLFLIALAFFFHEKYSAGYFLALISLFALNPRVLASLNDVVSDVPFLLVSTVTVFFIGRIFVERRPLWSDAADRALLGLLLALAFLIRHGGFVLVLTAAGAQILGREPAPSVEAAKNSSRRSRMDWVQLSPYLCFGVLAAIAYGLLPASISIGAPPLEESPRGDIVFLGGFFDGLPHPYLVAAATLPLAALGMVRGARAEYHFFLYALLTVLFSLFFRPVNGGLGYWLPLLPFYIHFALAGLRCAAEYLGRHWSGMRYLTAALLALVAVYFFQSTRDQALANIYAQRKASSGPFAATAQDIFSFIREKTPPDSVIAFFNPRAMNLFAGRRAIAPVGAGDLPRANYLCLYGAGFPENRVGELVKRGKLRLMYANSDFRLYEILS